MRYSTIFGKTLRNAPKDEKSVNARLLEQAGFVHKHIAGSYSFLPLGLRVLNAVTAIIRQEMNNLGAQELQLTALQPKELWDKTGRWDSLSAIMYQFHDHGKKDIGLATTHEEPITELGKKYISSYRDLPFGVYQIQTKFRDELRAKSGLIRGREFLMKDLYSFHVSQEDCDVYYEHVAEAYQRIFTRCGLRALRMEASGGDFTTSYSHEFQVLSPAGEDRLIHCTSCTFAQNAEIAAHTTGTLCPRCGSKLTESTGIEVGNIFKLGTRFSESLGLYYVDPAGKRMPVVMASYGIGPGRVLGTIVETSHDEQGIIWPREVTPFHVHIIPLQSSATITRHTKEIEKILTQSGYSYLIDDRDESAGTKFADADLIGIPIRLVLSERLGHDVEITLRKEKSPEKMELSRVGKRITDFYTD